jgi:hypothetical protein
VAKTKTSKPKPMSKPILQNQNHVKTKTIKTKSFGFGACLTISTKLDKISRYEDFFSSYSSVIT